MAYQVAIFDMDGTILNTLEDLADALNYALALHGFSTHSLDNVRKFVGNGIRKLIERALPKDTVEAEIQRVHADFTAYYKEHCADQTAPYAGIVEVIQTLREKGIHTAVVSNKADYGVQALCEQYFKGMFDVAIGERDGIRKKPAPDSVFAVLEQLQVEKQDAVYIGDSEVDFATAQNAGMDGIMVEWGFREKDYIASLGAKVFAKKAEDLLPLILD